MKNSIKKIMICLILSLAASLNLCSITVNATEEAENVISGEIEVLMNQDEASMSKYIQSFEEKYPQVTVKYVFYSDYENEVNKRIQNGDYGDVLLIPGNIGSDQYEKYLTLLGSVTELSKKYNFMDQSKTKGEEVFGIPSYAYLSGFLYNKEVFDKAGISELPKTMDDFMECMRLIKQHTDAIPFYTNYASDWATQYWNYFPFIEMTGDPYYRYSTFIYDENPFRDGSNHYEVYRLLYDLISLGYVEEDIAKSDWNKSKEMLNNGEIGCLAIGSWALSQFKAAGNNPDNVLFMPFPNEIDGKQYMTVLTDYSYGVASNSDNKEAARAFVDFMLDESGYAIDGNNISLLASDPYPDAFGDMNNIIILGNQSAYDSSYNIYAKMRNAVDIEGYDVTKRVMEAAGGITNETFEEITADWNKKWEAARPTNMKPNKQAKENEEIVAPIPIILDNSEIILSEAEKAYIQKHSTMIVGYNKNMAPFSYEQGDEFKGIARDLCDGISEKTGINMIYTGYESTDDMLKAIENNDIDVIAAIEKMSKEFNDIKYSKEYLNYMNVIVKKKMLMLQSFRE